MDLSCWAIEMTTELNQILKPFLLENYGVFAYDFADGWVFFRDESRVNRTKRFGQPYADVTRWGLKQPLPEVEDKLVLVINGIEWVPTCTKDPSMEFYTLQLHLI